MSNKGLVERITSLETPLLEDKSSQWKLALGILNCLFLGVGVIVAGCVENDTTDIIIGLCQLLIPFAGWLWALVWGVLMITRSMNEKEATPPTAKVTADTP